MTLFNSPLPDIQIIAFLLGNKGFRYAVEISPGWDEISPGWDEISLGWAKAWDEDITSHFLPPVSVNDDLVIDVGKIYRYFSNP